MRRRIISPFFITIGFLLLFIMIDSSIVYAVPAAQDCNTRPRQFAMGQIVNGRYAVVGGDTLYRIAIRFCVDQVVLQNMNNILDPNNIYDGQRLSIPGYTHDGRSCIGPTTIKISGPADNATVPTTFQVSGSAIAHPNSRITVHAYVDNGWVAGGEGETLWDNDDQCPNRSQGQFHSTLTLPRLPANTLVYLQAVVDGESSAPVPVVYDACSSQDLRVDSPSEYEQLEASFSVEGRGCLEATPQTVRVEALDENGNRLIDPQLAPLQNGQYRVWMTVRSQTPRGQIRITYPDGHSLIRNVYFAANETTGTYIGDGKYTDYYDRGCYLQLKPNARSYSAPNVRSRQEPVGTGTTGVYYKTYGRVNLSGVVWYMVAIEWPGRTQIRWAMAGDVLDFQNEYECR